MGKKFSDFLDNIEEKMTTINEENIEITPPKRKKVKKKVSSKKPVVVSEDSIQTKMMNELDRIGLNNRVISEIMNNVFGDRPVIVKKTSTTGVKKNKKTVKEENKKESEVDRASLILDGVEPMITPEMLQPIQNNNQQVEPESFTQNDFNLDDTAEHASALL